jgi:preprotein translocase subunit SecE
LETAFKNRNGKRKDETNNMIPVKEWWPSTRNFFREVWVEMKKTSWPGRSEVVGTTLVVIVACFVFGFYLFVVDSGLSWLVDKIFRAAGVIA